MKNKSLSVRKLLTLSMALVVLFAATFIRAKAAPTPDLTAAQLEAAIEEVFAGFAAFDVDRALSNFADDATLEDPVGTPAMQGKPAIAAYLQAFPTLFNQIKLYSLVLQPAGQEVAVKWRLRFTRTNGKVFFLEGIGFFKFNQDGKIQSEREFFDLAYFLAQMQD